MAEVQPLQLIPEESKHISANPNGTSNNLSSERADQSSKNPASISPRTHRFDPNFTQKVINATGPKASPRMRTVMASLIQHVHDFARENEITIDEWMAGVEMVNPPSPEP